MKEEVLAVDVGDDKPIALALIKELQSAGHPVVDVRCRVLNFLHVHFIVNVIGIHTVLKHGGLVSFLHECWGEAFS